MTGWTALTLHFKNGDAEGNTDKVEALFSHDDDKIYYSDEDLIKVLLSGYGRHKEAVKIITECREDLKEHQIIIDANDTTDSGDGTVYKVYEFGSNRKIDVYPTEIVNGEQPERGFDVAEEIQNQLELDFVPYSGR